MTMNSFISSFIYYMNLDCFTFLQFTSFWYSFKYHLCTYIFHFVCNVCKSVWSTYLCMYYDGNWSIGLMSRVTANGPGDRGSIPCRVIPKTQKMVLDATLLSTQHYKVRIKCKVEQSRERSCALPYTLV